MAHIEKYKAFAVGHMLAHYRRDPSSLGRSNIDVSKTAENYAIDYLDEKTAADEGRVVGEQKRAPNWNIVRKRLEAVDHLAEITGKRKTRKDAVLLADMVITLPKNVPAHDARLFFELTYEFLGREFGRENLMGGFIHADEVRTRKVRGEQVPTGEPVRLHMHVPFTPILDGRFNYKVMVPRTFYRRFHHDLGDWLEERMGYRPEVVLDQPTKAQKAMSGMTHDEMNAMKAEIIEPAEKEAAKVRAETDEKRQEYRQVRRELADAKGELKATNEVFLPAAKSNLQHEWDELAKAKAERQEMAEQLEQTKSEVEALRAENEALKGQVAIGRHEHDRLAHELAKMSDERRAMANEIELLRRRLSTFVAAARAFIDAVYLRGLGHALADVLAPSDKNPLVQEMFWRADNNPDADARLYDDLLEESGHEVLDEEQSDIDVDLDRLTRNYGLGDGGGVGEGSGDPR